MARRYTHAMHKKMKRNKLKGKNFYQTIYTNITLCCQFCGLTLPRHDFTFIIFN